MKLGVESVITRTEMTFQRHLFYIFKTVSLFLVATRIKDGNLSSKSVVSKLKSEFLHVDLIASFTLSSYDSTDAESWSEVGKLKGPRYGHAVIELHGQFMVIGGRTLRSSTMKTEICSFAGLVL